MKIDGNSTERRAFELALAGKMAESLALQREWIDEIVAGGEDYCPCQQACPHH